MKYLGKTHNIWHRMTLKLEEMVVDDYLKKKIKQDSLECYDFEPDDSQHMVTVLLLVYLNNS